MAEQTRVEPMKQLQELLQDDHLQEQVLAAKNQQEATRLLHRAAEGKGMKLSEHWLNDVFVDVKLTRWPGTFTEQELMLLASTRMMSDTPPKLCHTDSCGGHPGSCC